MELNVYSIFDAGAEAFTQPFFLPNDGLAIRAFSDNVNSDTKNNISEHPDQFTLFKIATWDDKTGTLNKLEINKSLGLGISYKTEMQVMDSKSLDTFTAQIQSLTKAIKILTSNNIHDIESAKQKEAIK